MPVIHLTDLEGQTWADFFRTSPACVIKFSAQWCGPCRNITPVFEQLSNQYSQLKFYEIDVDQCPVDGLEIRSLPTFFFHLGGTVAPARLVGADPQKLTAWIKSQVAFLGKPSVFPDSGL